MNVVVMNEVFNPENEEAQVALGRLLSESCSERALIFLHGDLGAGKTTLVRGFLQARGHKGAVKSPTYTLIEPYETSAGPVYHLDLYRLGDGEELEYLGLRDILAEQNAVLLIEWPQRGEGWLPEPDLNVELAYAANGRTVSFQAITELGRSVLQAMH